MLMTDLNKNNDVDEIEELLVGTIEYFDNWQLLIGFPIIAFILFQ